MLNRVIVLFYALLIMSNTHALTLKELPTQYKSTISDILPIIYGTDTNVYSINFKKFSKGESGSPVYQVTQDNIKLVFKTLPEGSTRNADEIICSILASNNNVGPQIYYPKMYSENHKNIIVMQYLIGKVLSPAQIIEKQKDLIDVLQNIHGIVIPNEVKTPIAFSPFFAIESEQDKNLTKKFVPTIYIDELIKIRQVFIKKPPKTSFIHGDLHIDQFILDSNKKIKVIDWRNAGIGDPVFDLSKFTLETGLDKTQSLSFYNEYLGRKTNKKELAHFLLLRQVLTINLYVSMKQKVNEKKWSTTNFEPPYSLTEFVSKYVNGSVDLDTEESLNILINILRKQIDENMLQTNKLTENYLGE